MAMGMSLEAPSLEDEHLELTLWHDRGYTACVHTVALLNSSLS